MFKKLGIVLIAFMTFPFIAGMGSKPQIEAPGAGVVEGNVTQYIATGKQGTVSPHEYGNITMKKYSGEGGPVKPVIFPHWWHRSQFICKVCHTDLGFKMKSGGNDIKMAEVFEGKWCGACHNGSTAFAATECDRCHSDGIAVKENRNFYETTKNWTSDGYGNRINWVKALNDKAIMPKTSIQGSEEMAGMDLDVITAVKDGIMPDVKYPHMPHTQLMSCESCHPDIFQQLAGTNKASMNDLFGGKGCGVCHGKVAFPFEDCFRCHSVPQAAPSKQP